MNCLFVTVFQKGYLVTIVWIKRHDKSIEYNVNVVADVKGYAL